jgi:ribosome maturation factor RimP
MAQRIDDLRATAERVAASHGLDIVDVELTGSAKFRTLRVFIEKDAQGRAALAEQAAKAAENATNQGGTDEEDAQGDALVLPKGVPVEQLSGVTHEDCVQFTRDFGTVIEVEDMVAGGEYTLEVSSPGLERKLTRPADYQRFLGGVAKIHTFTAIGAPGVASRNFIGRLKDFDGTVVTLDLSALKHKVKKKAGTAAEPPPASVQIPLPEIERAHLVAELD